MLAVCLALIDDEEDKKAFENLYNRNLSKAYAVAYNILKNEAVAEEACSEAFLNIAKSFQIVNKLEAHKLDYYVVITVRNTSLNMLKTEKNNNTALSFDDNLAYDDYDFSRADKDTIKDCIKQLSFTDQEIMYLRIGLGLEYKEIATALDISSVAARKRFQHAKGELSKLLTKGEIFNG